MSNRTELSYYSFPQLFDVMNICLEVSETNEYIKAIYTKQWNENLLIVCRCYKNHLDSTWFIKALLTCYILLWFGNPESDKNHCHDPEEGCCYPHLEMLCLVLQCFIYNLTIASVFNNTGSFDPCFPRRSILSAVANKRLILILAQFLARDLRVKISHALREVTV